MATVFKWILDPPSSLGSVSDEFAIGDFQIRLVASCLEIEAVMTGTEETASRLAEEYVGLLRGRGVHILLLTTKDFAALPPRIIQVEGPTQKERTFMLAAVRGARNGLLARSDAALRQCYEYWDQAIDNPDHALFYAYKLMEVLKKKFGGWAALIRTLALRDKIEYVKRAANDAHMDERHARGELVKNTAHPRFDRATALKYTEDILRAYEQYLRRDSDQLAR